MPKATLARQRLFAKAALGLARRRSAGPLRAELPVAAWQSCLKEAALLSEAERRGWPAAAAECRLRFGRELCELRCLLDGVNIELRELPPSTPATAREIYDDLVSLETEYPALRIDLKDRELAVTTEPISLDDVHLGPFEIVVDWSGGSLTYSVVALAPNPAGGGDSVTHPHVSDNTLCEGDGRTTIRRCLATGRLFDFFMVVSRTLATYNAESAFVSLEEWDGRSCSRCGDSPDRDYLSSCERCGCELCDECSVSCGACGRSCCDDCRAPCSACGDHCCGACLKRCRTCHEKFCEECLDDGTCNRCCEAVDEESEVANSSAETPLPAAVAVRLVQADVPA